MVGSSVWLWMICDVEPTVAVLGLSILWVTALPGLLYLQGINHSPLPFLPLVGVFYAVFFGFPVFLTPYFPMQNGKLVLYNNIVIEKIDPNILLMVLCGILVMEITYFYMKSWPLQNLNKFRLDSSDRANTLNILFWLLALIHFLYEFVPVINAIPSIGQFSKPVIYLAFGGLFLQWRACQRRSKNTPFAGAKVHHHGGVKTSQPSVRQSSLFRVVPVVHRRAPRCFV